MIVQPWCVKKDVFELIILLSGIITVSENHRFLTGLLELILYGSLLFLGSSTSVMLVFRWYSGVFRWCSRVMFCQVFCAGV